MKMMTSAAPRRKSTRCSRPGLDRVTMAITLYASGPPRTTATEAGRCPGGTVRANNCVDGDLTMSRYHDVYAAWQRDPEKFWADAASAIDWFKPWDAVLSRRDGLDRWFAGAECNTAWNCLDRHVAAGHGERIALIYDSAVTGVKRTYNYRALLNE